MDRTTQTLAGNDASHFFVTSPVAGSSTPTRIWVLGDSGTADVNAAAVRNAYLNFTGTTHTNLWLMLGDNAYENGTDSEYQAATTRQWTIAFWHHPPYSKGSHNSDTETNLVQMRQNFLPILEDAGVDLILSGHSHTYERSFLIDGHYGTSSTFTNAMKKDGGSGRADGTGAYNKSTLGPGPHEGAVYAVAGSSGQISGGALNHPAMFISLNNLGSMVLDVNGDTLDAKFLRENGAIADYFRIVKGTVAPVPPAAPSNLSASTISSSQINLTWTDNSNNENGFKVEQSTDGTNFTQIAMLASNTVSFPATGLTPSTTYTYRVVSFNDAGNSQFSNTASATTSAAPPAVPSAPSGLTATGVSRTQINLSWTDNSNNESGFRIERCKNANCINYVQIAQVGANVTTFADTGLTKNTTYRYRVRAFNAGGNSAYSAPTTGKTLK